MSSFRDSVKEQERIKNLMSLVVPGDNVLDIGARDGYISKKLTNYFEEVIALDLDKPKIEHPKIKTVQGNIINLDFSDDYFDLVFCAEVLEHIPSHVLAKACSQLARVSKGYVLIGVPYKQDNRFGRTTCGHCGGINPPWGHVNQFDLDKLKELFPGFSVSDVSYVGQHKEKTNYLSTWLMDFSGNPYGTYSQEESCIHCSKQLLAPEDRNIFQKIATKIAYILNQIQQNIIKAEPIWIHVLLTKNY